MKKRLDWRYHRSGCTSCKRTLEFLTEHGVEDGAVRSTSNDPIGADEALELLRGAGELFVTKGARILHFDLSEDRPSDDELLGLVLGRSGTLRAPTLSVGARLIVGYNAELLPLALA